MRGTFQKGVREIVRDATRVFDNVIGFGRITGSSLGEKNGSLLFDVEGLGFGEDTDDPNITTSNAEQRGQQEAYSAIGIVGRPPKKKAGDDPDLLLQSIHLRASDGLIPFAFRDQRIMKWLNKGSSSKTFPKDGQNAIAGYGGSFLSFETVDESNGPTNVCVLYCPFARNGSGVPQKAHMVMLDPTAGNESIAIVHSSGLAITMTEADGIVLRGGSTTRLVIKDGSIAATAGSISMQGNVALGANVAAAIPLLPGVASQPTVSVFFSP